MIRNFSCIFLVKESTSAGMTEKMLLFSGWIRGAAYSGIYLCMESQQDGRWAIGQSPILGTTITKARLMKWGYIPLATMFQGISKNTEMNQLFPMV
jgi:hypothetical protein